MGKLSLLLVNFHYPYTVFNIIARELYMNIVEFIQSPLLHCRADTVSSKSMTLMQFKLNGLELIKNVTE